MVSREALVHQKKKSSTANSVQQKQNVAWICITTTKIVVCLFTEKEIFKFEANDRNVNFLAHFCTGRISNGFGAIESNAFYFSDD